MPGRNRRNTRGRDKDVYKRQTIDLISYDDFDLDCLKKDGLLKRGSDLSKVYGDSDYVLATWEDVYKRQFWSRRDCILPDT